MSYEPRDVPGYPGVRVLYSDYARLTGSAPVLSDDPAYPFRLELVAAPPGYMAPQTVRLCGSMPKRILGGVSAAALGAFIEGEKLERDWHTVSFVLTSPEGRVLRGFGTGGSAD